MTAPNFPNNPTIGQQFVVGNNTFQWDGEKWKALSNADNSLRTQLAAPDSAVPVGGVTAGSIANLSKGAISLLDFFVAGEVDATAMLQRARDFLVARPQDDLPELHIPEGVYIYAESPNWAKSNLRIICHGNVIFRHTGTGNCFVIDAGATASVYNMHIDGNLFIDGNQSSGHGVYLRAFQHSYIKAIVRGCGVLKHGMHVEFAVCSKLNVIVSVNQNFSSLGAAWWDNARPLHGWYLTKRDIGESVSACHFPVPLVEGVTDTGIILHDAIQNRFTGGTSEANNLNIDSLQDSRDNTFDGIDLEVAASGIGLREAGARNTYNQILDDALTQCLASSKEITFNGGIFNGVSNAGSGNRFRDCSYSSGGQSFTDTGTGTEKTRVYNLTGASFDDNVIDNFKIKSGATIKKHLSAVISADFIPPASVPGVTKLDLTVTGASVGDTVIVSSSVTVPDNFILQGYVVAADTVSVRWYQLSGAPADPDGGGGSYRIDVWGH